MLFAFRAAADPVRIEAGQRDGVEQTASVIVCGSGEKLGAKQRLGAMPAV